MSEARHSADPSSPRRPSYFDRHASSTAPPLPASPNLTTPGSPRTPIFGRSLSGNLLASPGSLFRADDEVHVIELGARYLRIGFGGEAQPRAVMSFGPETSRRVGDYTAWLPDEQMSALRKRRRRPKLEEPGTWGMEHALYPLDLRSCSLGLVSDKLARAIREAVVTHLLAIDDSKRRSLVLAIPSLLPHPLLSTVLHTLFSHFPNPQQITLLSTPVCATIAAGLRNALVVDIGYHETTVTAIAELKEIGQSRSEQGMRRLNREVAKMLVDKLDSQTGAKEQGVTFEDCEEVIWRMCWCRQYSTQNKTTKTEEKDDPAIDVSLPSRPATDILPIPFFEFAHPVESTFFSPPLTLSASNPAKQPRPQQFDDNLNPLPHLLYHTLLRLPLEIRSLLLSRITFTGGGSHIPGLKTRLLAELQHTITTRGWNFVDNYGSAADKPRRKAINAATNGHTVGLAPLIDDETPNSVLSEKYALLEAEEKKRRDEEERKRWREKAWRKRPQRVEPILGQVPSRGPPSSIESVLSQDAEQAKDEAPATTSTPSSDTVPTAVNDEQQTVSQQEPQPSPQPDIPNSEEPPPQNRDIDPHSLTPASDQPPLPDPILARMNRNIPSSANTNPKASSSSSSPSSPPSSTSLPTPNIKSIRTLHPYTGASLLTGLRQRGVVEIERDSFLAHGLAGAERDGAGVGGGYGGVEGEAKRRSREQEAEMERRRSVLVHRQGDGGGRRGAGGGAGWTLGPWA